MTTPIYQPQSYTDFQGLSQLKSQAKDDSDGALRTVAEQFESIFIGMMMKSMRDASIGDQLFDSNAQNNYMDMYDKELSMSLSSKGGIGLADTIVRQLSQSRSAASEKQTLDAVQLNRSPSNIPTRLPISNVPEKTVSVTTTRFESPEQFVEALWPLAQQSGKELGVEPKVLISQAALETGWGSRINQHADGKSSYNLFNIKADSRWSGDHVTVSTIEFQSGIPVQQSANFRAYSSYEESFNDYVNFISQSPRYGHALEKEQTASGYIEALQQAGYATDPHYADKVKNIMQREVMQVSDV